MDGNMKDRDELYDSLPEMCDIYSTLIPGTSVSSSVSGQNSNASSLSSETLSKDVASSGDVKHIPIKRCYCRDSVQWVWESKSKSAFVELVNENMDVKFHKHQSNGTAVVRGTEPMSNNQYFWEVKMTYPIYGTDIMIGIGTSEAEIKDLQNRYVSLLGMDSKTWGLSYTGLFHHNGQQRCYATTFGQGSVIGVHLDLWKGTLSFYKDRKHLGIASSGLKGKTLYAMASSTAARSGMRIIRSCSFPSSLQFLCCAKLREVIPEDKNVLDVVQVPPGLKHFLQTKLSWLLCSQNLKDDVHNCSLNENITDKDNVIGQSPVDGIINDPNSITGQYVLLGSVLLSNYNRFQSTLTLQLQDGSDDSGESVAKRSRHSYPDKSE